MLRSATLDQSEKFESEKKKFEQEKVEMKQELAFERAKMS